MFESIVVGTDGSPTATQALKAAAALAKPLGAKVHVVSAYEPMSGARIGGAEDDPELGGVSPTFEVEGVLESAAGQLHAEGIEVETHARKGDPAEAILKVAEQQDAHLIVVGNKGMRGAKRFLLGSVPDKISHHAPCSVLIVKTIG